MINAHTTDEEINAILGSDAGQGVTYTRHFSQSEDFFFKLAEPVEVPSFSIHHDVRKPEPSAEYIRTLREYIIRIKNLVPGVFRDLVYIFDPAEILRPTFYKLFHLEEHLFLYHMRIDMVFKPQHHEVVTRGTNDTTPVYRTDQLVLDANVIPLRRIQGSQEKPEQFLVDELISETWIGETGRGYFVQGIWIDSDLTKFFSKLMMPKGKRVYPFYPFNSKFRTVCLAPLDLEAKARGSVIPILHKSREFLRPHLDAIQQVLREQEFNESLPLFQEIKATVPPELEAFWTPVSMKVYLNEEDMKEFQVVIDEK